MDQPRNRHVPNTMADTIVRLCGLGWHGPISVVGAPSRSDGYGVAAPPRIWGRGIPGTRALARVAARCTSSTAF